MHLSNSIYDTYIDLFSTVFVLIVEKNRKHNTNVPLYILSWFLEYLVLQDYSYLEELSVWNENNYSCFEDSSICSEEK